MTESYKRHQRCEFVFIGYKAHDRCKIGFRLFNISRFKLIWLKREICKRVL